MIIAKQNHGGFMISFGDHRHSTKKIAEQEAAMNTLENIDENELKTLAGRDLY
jgi:dsRNA-specific ribonuclease